MNACTHVPTHLPAWHAVMRGMALAPAAAYARAVVAHRERSPNAEPSLHRLGYRLYVVAGANLSWRDVGIRPDEYLVVGRHSHCDLMIAGDAISLRHALVRASLLDDGVPIISILDLESASGFELSDGATHRAVVASGPLVFRIGAVWIVALPHAADVSDALEAPAIRTSDEGSHRIDPRRDADPPATRVSRITRITSIPAVTRLGHPREVDTVDRYEIAMTLNALGVGARFTESALERGVLIGRADKCVDGLRGMARQNTNVSRVHALVIRERDGIRLYDLASVNGISDGVRARVRAVALAERKGERTKAYFNATPPVTLEWRMLG